MDIDKRALNQYVLGTYLNADSGIINNYEENPLVPLY